MKWKDFWCCSCEGSICNIDLDYESFGWIFNNHRTEERYGEAVREMKRVPRVAREREAEA